ncbi:hypothetical protein DICVIV_12306 [Dictyocaulus viviparus]|uniref:SAM domain-containing protein n=1 Tax=Dictyocaulus viviparus TaxID=29172 RepID=A0A0D8XD79_DICVI|nr:hypothetical protein DICVIV_12306 [Dictyocaulus viviparus]
MRSQSKMLLFLLFAMWTQASANGVSTKATRNVVVTAEEEKIRDSLGYLAIVEIHREMDDDHSGSIDRKETTGFMTEDMHMRGSDRLRRENAFHGNDDAITVDDLWEAWFESDERAWTNEQVLNWIVNEVNLPMYGEKIIQLKIDGTILPRLAVHNSTFMTNQLGIKSSVHRQKLRLNALDVVLFGHRYPSSKGKDIALALLLLLLTSVLILYAKQRHRARLQVNELSQRLKELKNMENEFDDVQKKWNEERSRRSTADGGVSQNEVNSLRVQLEAAERRLEENCIGNIPLSLQPLLRKTCEIELAFLEKQRQECVKEMHEAIELVDRLQKKTSSVLSSLKLATGASSSSDQVDSKIFALKSRMDKIQVLTRETQERWLQIELICGFPVFNISASSSVSSKLLSSGGCSTAHVNSQTLSIGSNTSAPLVVPQHQPTFLSSAVSMDEVSNAMSADELPCSVRNDVTSIPTWPQQIVASHCDIPYTCVIICNLFSAKFFQKRSIIVNIDVTSISRIAISIRKMVQESNAACESENKEKEIHVMKIKRIPYGFFEKQLWEYFTQFGKVVRVRVARSVKTGNFKGWAYVGFADKDVAEIAVETMNGYLMFEKRLSCRLMDPKDIPKSMKSGPRLVPPPRMLERAKKHALLQNKTKTSMMENKAKVRRKTAYKRRLNKLRALDIDYDCDTVFLNNYGKAASCPQSSVGECSVNVRKKR